jgi:hypothetical protein
MIKVENIETWGFGHAIRGMRNPLNSWKRSDSECVEYEGDVCESCKYRYTDCSDMISENGFCYRIGNNDLTLMQKLYKAGTEHRKYLRQIFVSMDITAPLYWWSEYDTYKVGTTANSCSKMHKLTSKEFAIDDFSHDHLTEDGKNFLLEIIDVLNDARYIYNHFDKCVQDHEIDKSLADKKIVWWQMIQLLPNSYNQRRTVTVNYENVFNIINQRSNHKLDEWNKFVEILKTLPYVKEIGKFDADHQED